MLQTRNDEMDEIEMGNVSGKPGVNAPEMVVEGGKHFYKQRWDNASLLIGQMDKMRIKPRNVHSIGSECLEGMSRLVDSIGWHPIPSSLVVFPGKHD